MARQIDKCRLCRSEGKKLYLKGARCYSAKCSIEKKGAQSPGVHGAKRSFRPSNYSIQLREKQKVKRQYGLLERQFRRFLKLAQSQEGAEGENLLILLERRLDNVIYRLGLASSRMGARQFISHGHVKVNGQAVKTASFILSPQDKIELSAKALLVLQKNPSETEPGELPSWLKKSKGGGQLLRFPKREELDKEINENLIIEFYSR